ncbi:MAG: flagellar hook-length control protein FliK, partial [Candidatus Sulfotelmatobacter sp.]
AEPAPAMATGPVQMAQMVSRVGQAEMRIGVNTSAFGSVEVRTVIHASDVGLTIGSEKGDLRGLLGNEMPALTNSLQQQNLRLSNVSFTQGFSSAGNGAGGGDSQPRSFVPAPVPSSSMSSEVAGDDFADLPPPGVFSGGSGGLSILA